MSLWVEHSAWIFLGVALASAAFTVNAHAPIRWPATLAIASFFAGWLTSEMVGHTLALQAALALACVAAGGLSAWPGWVAAAVMLLSWLLLFRLLDRARAAGEVMNRALSEGLGGGFAARLEPRVRDQAPLAFGWRQLLFPFSIKHPDVKRVRDIVYAEGPGYALRLDVYRRRDGAGRKRPVLLQIHGGGWVVGSKDQQGLPLVTHLASRGWVCVSANYRLSPRATFPDPLLDLKRAIRWIKEHIEEHGGDPDFIVVTGGSAGGHLAALVALTANDPELQPGFEDLDTRVKACVAFYGVYDLTDRHGLWPHKGLRLLLEVAVMKASVKREWEKFDRASPMTRAHEAAPPFLIIHGDKDTLVPVAEARRFAQTLREISKAPVVYAEVPGAQHAFEVFPSPRTALVIRGVEQFVEAVHAEHARGAQALSAPSSRPVRAASEPSFAEPQPAVPKIRSGSGVSEA
ncbi:MAG: alpha/beta hydrolase [Polyangiaceae bacterium]|jgi:acetyl esterase/lipase|nr:alpha/beta hydrolase [Polyangiaceae bacterium]